MAQNLSIPSLNRAITNLQDSTFEAVDVSKTALRDIQQRIRDASLVVIESEVIEARIPASEKPGFVRYEHQRTPEHYAAIFRSLLVREKRVVLLLGNYDIQKPLPGHLSDLEAQSLHGIVWQFVRQQVRRSEVPENLRQHWMMSQLDPHSNWQRICRLIPRQIEYVHSIDPIEFRVSKPRRLFDVAIPGASYRTRQLATASAKSAGITVFPYRSLDFAIRRSSFASTLLIGRRNGDMLRFRLRRSAMDLAIRSSAMAYTCGGPYHFLVRKFLEIPALGVPLIATAPEQFSRLGFVESEHYLGSEPEQLGQRGFEILENPSVASALAKRAYALTRRRHTSVARAKDLISTFCVMSRDDIAGAQYVNGELSIH